MTLSLLPVNVSAATNSFILSGDAAGSFAELDEAVAKANEAPGQYVINISGDGYALTTTPIISAGVDILLKTDGGGSAISITQASGRHFTVNGALTLNNVILDGETTGGGVTVTGGARLIMEKDSVIQKCRAYQGGGIYVYPGGELIMRENSVVDACQSTHKSTGGSGGGIYLEGAFAMYDEAAVTNCIANGGKGAGIAACHGAATFTMHGGKISGNQVLGVANDYQAGGVFLYGRDTSASFFMRGGEISGNKAAIGGGVSVYYGACRFYMDGGKITDNEAVDYGTGTVSGQGGGVYVQSWGGVTNFEMAGGEISNNKAVRGGGIYTYDGPILKLNGRVVNNRASSGGGGVYVHATVTLGGDCLVSNNDAPYGGGVAMWGGSIAMEGKSSVTENTAATSGGGVYFDAGSLTMNGDSAISNNSAIYGGGMYVSSTAAAKVINLNERGSYSGNTATSGGGVYLANGSMTMTGNSAVTNNRSTMAGGVYLRNAGSMTMNDNAAVSNNVADDNGGGFWIIHTAGLTVNSGTIAGNRALKTNIDSDAYGGGVLLGYPGQDMLPTFIMRAGAIRGNYAEGYGGGVAVFDGGTVTISGGAISQNVSENDGGGIYVAETGAANITNARLTGNSAAGSGGAIFTGSYEYANPLTDPTKYQNISTTEGTAFFDNVANALYNPPDNPEFLPNIKAGSVSAATLVKHPLNNFDINYENKPEISYVTVTYNINDGSENPASYTLYLAQGGDHTVLSNVNSLFSFTAAGRAFTNWTDKPIGGTAYATGSSIGNITSNIVLYAQWNTAAAGTRILEGTRAPYYFAQDRFMELEEPDIPLQGEGAETEENTNPQTGAISSCFLFGISCLFILSGIICRSKRGNFSGDK